MSIFGFLFIGLMAGWLAGRVTNSAGWDLLIDLLVGVIGALLGGFAFYALGMPVSGFFGGLVAAMISAMLALFAKGFVKHGL
ncbi:MAG: GlsB/YeaQ/YmgE family stress response membrane protein [Gammaproteobacteria bacterium]|nr:GlsB/YeaQ/YmgE family stress response membrane protein [Gammaproteobacteria bacterium]